MIFRISKLAAKGRTTSCMTGNRKMIRGRKRSRLICLNSFSNKYFSILIIIIVF